MPVEYNIFVFFIDYIVESVLLAITNETMIIHVPSVLLMAVIAAAAPVIVVVVITAVSIVMNP